MHIKNVNILKFMYIDVNWCMFNFKISAQGAKQENKT